ncbi:MAG: ABC transporter permease, partial [Actinomycetota bacterium]
MSVVETAPSGERLYPRPSLRRAAKMVRRNLLSYKHYWIAFVSGFFEPIFYLTAVGFGVGQFVDSVPYKGLELEYAAFLAPGMLAAATMNGALFDGFFSLFFKLNWMKIYEGIITTPMNIADIAVGELMWGVIRATTYGFGLVDSWWGLLAIPAVVLSSAAHVSGAMIFTFVSKEITLLEKVMTLVVLPMFLFSGIFFPLDRLPEWAQTVAWFVPLHQAVNM